MLHEKSRLVKNFNRELHYIYGQYKHSAKITIKRIIERLQQCGLVENQIAETYSRRVRSQEYINSVRACIVEAIVEQWNPNIAYFNLEYK